MSCSSCSWKLLWYGSSRAHSLLRLTMQTACQSCCREAAGWLTYCSIRCELVADLAVTVQRAVSVSLLLNLAPCKPVSCWVPLKNTNCVERSSGVCSIWHACGQLPHAAYTSMQRIQTCSSRCALITCCAGPGVGLSGRMLGGSATQHEAARLTNLAVLCELLAHLSAVCERLAGLLHHLTYRARLCAEAT